MKKGIKDLNRLFMKNNKGISPVVATILLVAIVIVIALIIFLWFRGIVGDYGEKFGKNVELVCEDVNLDVSYSGGTLFITNDGNVPVFRISAIRSKEGSHETKNLDEISSGWPETGLSQNAVFSGSVESGGFDKITLVPILIAVSDDSSKKSFTCDESYGYEVEL